VPSPKKVVVVNLRAQPVEIQHGGQVVVLPEFARAELPDLPNEEGQLAELARQGAVAVLAPSPAPNAPSEPATATKKKTPAPKKPPPKSPEEGS
jgi:hypothetical protein